MVKAATPTLEACPSEPNNAITMVKDATESPVSTVTEASTDSTFPLHRKGDDKDYWPTIATMDDIPGWLKDNGYIVTGHPMPTYSYRKSFRLWRCLHMETMNIWTHLIGSAATIAAGVGLYRYAISRTALALSAGDKFAFAISLTAGALCFGLSTTFHTLRSHSYNVHHFWGRLDIFGICLLALGAGTSATYYAFFCEPTLQKVYWSLNACAALGAAVVLFDTGGGGSKMRTLRGGVFAGLATVSLLPIFHGIGRLGWMQACTQLGAQWYLSEVVTLTFGVTMFVARMPERLSPGTFDIWGHSHQLHHTCAVIGMGFHLAALVTSFGYRQRMPKC
jgi:adiponectin receptor